jgi:hypothetical protein
MKTETVEEFKNRGGKIQHLSKVEISPGKENKSLTTKLGDKWPTGHILRKKEQK